MEPPFSFHSHVGGCSTSPLYFKGITSGHFSRRPFFLLPVARNFRSRISAMGCQYRIRGNEGSFYCHRPFVHACGSISDNASKCPPSEWACRTVALLLGALRFTLSRNGQSLLYEKNS